MTVTSITASAQFKRPRKDAEFSTDSVMLSLTAELSPADDFVDCAHHLQAQVDQLALHHLEKQQDRHAAYLRNQQERWAAQRSQAATAAKTANLAAKHGGTF